MEVLPAARYSRLPLTSELDASARSMRTPLRKRKWSRNEQHLDQKEKEKDNRKGCPSLFGRSVEIRTPGLQYPKLARYQLRYTSKYYFIKKYITVVYIRRFGHTETGALPVCFCVVNRRLGTLGLIYSQRETSLRRKQHSVVFVSLSTYSTPRKYYQNIS